MPIKIAKQMDSKNPNAHPLATRRAVLAVKTHPMVNMEMRVRITEREEKRTTIPENPRGGSLHHLSVRIVPPEIASGVKHVVDLYWGCITLCIHPLFENTPFLVELAVWTVEPHSLLESNIDYFNNSIVVGPCRKTRTDRFRRHWKLCCPITVLSIGKAWSSCAGFFIQPFVKCIDETNIVFFCQTCKLRGEEAFAET